MTPQDQETLFKLLAQAITEKVANEATVPVAAPVERSSPELGGARFSADSGQVPTPDPQIPAEAFRAEGRARREAAVEAPREFAARRAPERAPAPARSVPTVLKVGAMPLIAVCIVICAVLAYRDFDAFLLMFSASGRVIVGATIGLLIDLFAMPNHQPEALEGIEQGWAWNRRLWLMAASAVCLGMQP